jgi:TRAP transporter TatT component family protein
MRSRLLLLVLLAACGAAPREISAPVVHGTAADDHDAAVAEAERLWPERGDEAKLRAAIAAWRRAVAAKDDDVASYEMLARAEFLLADNFLAGAEAKHMFEECAALADRGLRARAPAFEARRRAGAEVDAAAADLGVEAAPLLYWWGLCAIRWADADGWTSSARMYKPVFRAIEQVGRLDPAYARGGADRFFGSARAEAPAIAGGSLKESLERFQRALAIDPTALQTRYELAAHYARKAGDARLYEETLRFIAETPAREPEDGFAKRRAAKLPPRL